MKKTKFKKLLFDIACSAVACDGHIDDREVRELQYIDKSTTYFKDIDLSRRLDRFVKNFNNNSTDTIDNVFEQLKTSYLNPVEEMLVLEIILRLVYADTKIEKREIDFVQSIRSCLTIDDNIIKQRFGQIDILINSQKKSIDTKEISLQNDSIGSVDLTNLENMYFSIDDQK